MNYFDERLMNLFAKLDNIKEYLQNSNDETCGKDNALQNIFDVIEIIADDNIKIVEKHFNGKENNEIIIFQNPYTKEYFFTIDFYYNGDFSYQFDSRKNYDFKIFDLTEAKELINQEIEHRGEE